MTDLNTMWRDYELDHLEQGIKSLFPQKSFSLFSVLEHLLVGDFREAFHELWDGLLQSTVTDLGGLKNVFVSLLVIGIVSAFVVSMMNLFEAKQISDLGFYFIYLSLALVLICSFKTAMNTSEDTLRKIIEFHEILFPSYLLTVGMATGTTTATFSYQLCLLLIYGVEILFRGVLFPLIHSYMMLTVLNGVWPENKLTLLIKLMGRIITWILNICLWAVLGTGFFQSVMTPVIDNMGNSIWKKVIHSIPGIGDTARSVMEMIMGSATLLKNSVGVVLMILLLGMCITPIIKIGGIFLTMKAAAACMAPVGDKRVTACTDQAGEAVFLLLRTVATTMLLFGITLGITIVTAVRG